MATVAGRYVHIFQVTLHKETKGPSKESFRSGPFEIVQSYEDPNTQEAFYRCVFAGKCLAKPVMLSAEFTATTTGSSPIKQDSFLTTTEHESSCSMEQPTPVYNPRRERKKLTNLEETSTPSLFPNKPNPRNACNELLCVAGKNGCIKVIDTQRLLQLYELYHTDEVWDLQRSPANDWVIVSASKDTSVKVWDLESGGMLLYVLAGHGGHRDGVISGTWPIIFSTHSIFSIDAAHHYIFLP
jgi:WD40 repeat protein